ncbi:MAG TPA: sigma 54-interacting transcriptional regulator [Polyangiaceae bacterium]|nr:sigma 54-interacting transcriptional regulator [Polyangiaceae bacterium]
MQGLPPRYLASSRLGQGGGGEVWAVRDRVTGAQCAFKVLARGAGEPELVALVREAVALSGLEGLGVPRVLGFGTLADKRRYLVRELVEGRSLDEIFDGSAIGASSATWLEPLAHAAEQLTALHRAGLLHGDVKPANVIVGPDRRGTLVDLGLAAPWREGGTHARGLTPKYAAPELLTGQPLTVRAEVYSLGATLAEGLARRGSELADDIRIELAKVAARAKEEDPQRRFPSTGELASALRHAAGLGPPADVSPAWPVLGVEAVGQTLLDAVNKLSADEALAVVGGRGSGRTTLLRRLAWTLGVEGRAVMLADAPRTELSRRDALALELGPELGEGILAVDDADELDEPSRALLREAVRKGAKLVVVGSAAIATACGARSVRVFEVPPLDEATTSELLRRAMPSLSSALGRRLATRAGGCPGPLRAAVRSLAGRAVVSEADIDDALEQATAAAPRTVGEALGRAERLIDLGRVNEAQALLDRKDVASAQGDERARAAIATARLRTARGEAALALDVLGRHSQPPNALSRAWHLAHARACLRMGRFAEAIAAAEKVLDEDESDALAIEAMTTLGVAQSYKGDDAAGRASVETALALAQAAKDPRAEGFARGSLGIVHQRAGRNAEAKRAYEASLASAERARDAGTVAASHLNLAGLAREEGDIAAALAHYEATVDLGKRAGGLLAVLQAQLNLVNLDLYLGRHARARATIDELLAQGDALPGAARAQLLGCQAELAARTGDAEAAARGYERCAKGYEAQGRARDAAEARLEGMVMRAERDEPSSLLTELSALEKSADGGLGEHESLALLVRGILEARRGREAEAKRALDEAVSRAQQHGQQERAVWALGARAKVLAAQGAYVQARRDVESALATLEQTASTLPRDLREVFWDEPRRAALRSATVTTMESRRPPPAQTLSSLASDASILRPRPAEDKLARMLEITREIATEHDLERLLAKVTDHALALLGGERGFVVLVGPDGELSTHTARDRRGDDPHAQFSRSVAEKVVQTGEPVVALRAREDERLAEAVSVHQLMIQSIACVPVRGAPPLGRPIGALYVETRVRPGARFQEELPLLSAFADQAAIAIEGARLLEENRARARELEEKNAELEAAHARLEEALGRRTEQLAEARRDLKQVRAELKGHFGYAGLVGTSAAMRRLYSLIDRIKDTDVPALVTGESGTGKEVVARAIHQAGVRAKREFLGVNCGAIPANLLESELFGHVRGAFTGADRDRKGLLREAEGGTLLLDEIGEMPLKMQAGMLRALQEKTVRPVGGTKEEPFDARIIAATNRDLEQMVEEGTFREDLFYRLHVIELRVPPLRERTEDIPPLIDHFLSLFSRRYGRERKTIGRDALRRMCAYDWPGNVRQLEHVLLNAWLMGEDKEILAEDIQLPDQSRPSSRSSPRAARNEAEYKDSERERILRALAACNWNRVKAAELTGIPRRTFYRRLKEFGIL